MQISGAKVFGGECRIDLACYQSPMATETQDANDETRHTSSILTSVKAGQQAGRAQSTVPGTHSKIIHH